MADVNLLVAGAGGGIVAALRAQELGLSVAVIDANEHFLRANNTSMSTAMIPGAGSRFQREAESMTRRRTSPRTSGARRRGVPTRSSPRR